MPDSKLIGALIAWVGSLVMMLTYHYLVKSKRAVVRARPVFVVGFLSAASLLAGFSLIVMATLWSKHDFLGEIGFSFLLVGALFSIITWILFFIYK